MKCPVCGQEVDVPKSAYYSAGERPVLCPNGHQLAVTTTFIPDEKSSEKPT